MAPGMDYLLMNVSISHHSSTRKMQLGTTFTIEPVLTEGSAEWITWEDGWTVATADGGRAAQFEHTVLITETGCEVLTWDGDGAGGKMLGKC